MLTPFLYAICNGPEIYTSAFAASPTQRVLPIGFPLNHPCIPRWFCKRIMLPRTSTVGVFEESHNLNIQAENLLLKAIPSPSKPTEL
jgi:hypothetical protein